MFTTFTAWKSKIHELWCGPNQQYWLGVELAMNKPWFLMTVSQTESVEGEKDVVFRRNILVGNVTEVENLAKEEGHRLQKLEHAMVVLPNWVNGTGTWTMEPLAAVWMAVEPDAPGSPVEICETQSGVKYVTTFGACPLENLTNHTLRYRFPVP